MNWSLVREAGIEFAKDPCRHGLSLHHPVYAERGSDDIYLIVDEFATEKQIPFRFECRTVRIDADYNILFDTRALGINDGTGCMIDDGRVAILRRTTWDLLIFSPNGEVTKTISLARMSKRMPRYVRCTFRHTLLVVFFNRSFDIDVIEVDFDGSLLWYLPSSVEWIGIVGNVQLLESDTLLVADSFRHVAIEIDRSGDIVWQFGQTDQPSNSADRLANPTSALSGADGQRLIADTRNHRIVSITPNGAAETIDFGRECLTDPAFANRLDNQRYLVCDTGNQRVIEVDNRGQIAWQCGRTLASRRYLSYPRSVERTGDGAYLVADTANDRVVQIDAGKINLRDIRTDPALFWPRCARLLPNGSLLIADSRNGRIIETSPEGRVLNELSRVLLGTGYDLEDPHDVRKLANGHLLITDSSLGLVIEVDWKGNVYRVFGDGKETQLRDPHSAQAIDDRRIIIADTGNHRIVIAGDGGQHKSLGTIGDGLFSYRLRLPRYVEVSRNGSMVIADTGNNRVLGARLDGTFLWEFTDVPNSPLARLNQPRWATLLGQDEVIICDHFHHRVLHVRRER